jgi:acyl carrier protein
MTTLQHADTSIRRVLRDHGRLAIDPDKLGPDTDLYQTGMTSHASVNVMLALEGEFDVEFPDHMLKRNVFRSIGSIERALRELIAA